MVTNLTLESCRSPFCVDSDREEDQTAKTSKPRLRGRSWSGAERQPAPSRPTPTVDCTSRNREGGSREGSPQVGLREGDTQNPREEETVASNAGDPSPNPEPLGHASPGGSSLRPTALRPPTPRRRNYTRSRSTPDTEGTLGVPEDRRPASSPTFKTRP